MYYFFIFVDMSDSIYSYYDTNYYALQPQGHQLLLIITGPCLSLAVVEIESKKVKVWAHSLKIDEIGANHKLKEILYADYTGTKIAVQSPVFLIIPNELFDEGGLIHYSRLLGCSNEDYVLSSKLDEENQVVFKLTDELYSSMRPYVDLKEAFFAGTPLLAALKESAPASNRLYVHIENSMVQIVCYNAEKLGFYNCYEFKNPDELMYYIVLVANQLNISLDETSLILSGDITVSDNRLSRMNELLPKVYFNQTQILNLPPGYLAHQVLTLAGLTLCASLVEN
jgi:hypothetical protein